MPTGDASISAAMKNGGITRVHHVDNETTNLLGIYAKYVTIVKITTLPQEPRGDDLTTGRPRSKGLLTSASNTP